MTMTSEIYSGEKVDGLNHGKDGFITFFVNPTLEQFFSGFGTANYSDGGSYIGYFQRGIYHGEGTLSFPDGMSYKGTFSEGKRHGKM